MLIFGDCAERVTTPEMGTNRNYDTHPDQRLVTHTHKHTFSNVATNTFRHTCICLTHLTVSVSEVSGGQRCCPYDRPTPLLAPASPPTPPAAAAHLYLQHTFTIYLQLLEFKGESPQEILTQLQLQIIQNNKKKIRPHMRTNNIKPYNLR